MTLRSKSKALSLAPYIFFSFFSFLASYKDAKGIKAAKYFCLRGALASYLKAALRPLAQNGLLCPRDTCPATKLNKTGYLVEVEGNHTERKKRVLYLSVQIPARYPAEGPRL